MPRPIRHCDTSMPVLLDRAVAVFRVSHVMQGLVMGWQFCHTFLW